MLKIASNIEYLGNKPLDSRDCFETIVEMSAFPITSIDDGHISYCKETGKYYKFNSANETDSQLGKWKEYVNDVSISSESENAIENKDDGIYVKDLSEQLKSLNFAQKIVNEDLDYCYIYNKVQKGTTNITANKNIIPLFDNNITNMEIDSDGYIKLNSGKRYAVFSGILTKELFSSYIQDKDGNKYSNRGYIDPGNKYSNVAPCTIINPKKDIYIGLVTDNSFAFWTDCSYVLVIEITKAITIDPLDYVNESNGIEDTPVGHIIAHMGTTAPKHYLVCDGTIYNIVDYPYLAEHIKTEFGSYNYFGGDGTDTFAVPDLKGEFLRGTGINSHENQGNGGDVGKHQDATAVNQTFRKEKTVAYYGDIDKSTVINADKAFNTTGKYIQISGTALEYNSASTSASVRPTNTSVLYCIKCEPTYFMQNTYNGNVYSTNEQIVGRWIDGKTIYQKTFTYDTLSATNQWINLQDVPNIDTVVSLNYLYSIGNGEYRQSSDGIIAGTDDQYRIQVAFHNGSISYVLGNGFVDNSAIDNIHITMQYTKTTDSSSDTSITPSSSCDCVSYTDEEIHTAIENIFGGEN